jgi:aspartate kinase
LSLLIQKFGGTSVASPEQIRAVAQHVRACLEAGDQVVLVLSAMGQETDRLVSLASSFEQAEASPASDLLLATGEQVTVALAALALAELGIPAQTFTGAQVPIVTDDTAGKARIQEVGREALSGSLAAGQVPVVAGFQGVRADGQLTTLGRGGSDTTAVAIAAALDADECQIFTDVEGVFSADPKLCPGARRIERITYDEMLELASLGSKVLQTRAVEFAGRHGVPLRVLPSAGIDSATAPNAGTRIEPNKAWGEQPVVSGLATEREAAEICIAGLPDQPGVAYQLLAPLYAARIDVDMLVQNAPQRGEVEFRFTVPREEAARAASLLAEVAARAGWPTAVVEEEVAKISVVGVGLRSHADIASRLFDTLAREGVNVRLVATSESKISVLVDAGDLDRGVVALHATFDLSRDGG